MVEIGVLGSGPAARSCHGLIDVSEHALVTFDNIPSEPPDCLICIASVGASAFSEIQAAGITDWIAVELGGIGGRVIPDINASVTVFRKGQGCYDCLRQRLDASHPDTMNSDSMDVQSELSWVAGAIAGNLATSVAGSDSGGTVITLPYTERTLYPVPFCDCHDVPDSRIAFDSETLDIDTISSMVDPTIDPVVGLLSSIGEAHSFPLAYYLASLTDTSPFSDARAPEQAAGAAVSWTAAFMKSVGEALERYAAACYRTELFRTASESAVEAAVSPTDFVLPDNATTYAPSDSIWWIQGMDLASSKSVFLPAEFVVFPPPEHRFRPAITTGLGLGSSTVDAVLAGLYEVIERDAVMIGWYSSFEPFEVTFEDEQIETLRSRARAEDLTVTTLLMTQDIDTPVITACVHRDDTWPKFAVGSKAHLDATTAGIGAIEEALQNWMELRAMGKSRAEIESGNIAEYASFPDIAKEFVSARRAVAADSIGPTELPEGRNELEMIIDRVSLQNLEVYASRLTTRDLEQVGVEVTRVLIPGAQPLFLGERYFGDRAESVPDRLGFTATPDAPRHPYP